MYLLGGLIFIASFIFAFKAGLGELSSNTIFYSLILLTTSFLILSYIMYNT